MGGFDREPDEEVPGPGRLIAERILGREAVAEIRRNRREMTRFPTSYPKSPKRRRAWEEALGRANDLVSNAETAIEHRKLDVARDFLNEALGMYEKLGARVPEAHCHNLLGEVALEQEDTDLAEQHLIRALLLSESLPDTGRAAACLLSLATIASLRSRDRQAEEYARLALAAFEEVGDRLGCARCHFELGKVTQAESRAGARTAARSEVNQALRLLARPTLRLGQIRQWRFLRAQCHLRLGTLSYWDDDRVVARRHLERARRLFRRVHLEHYRGVGEAACELELGRWLGATDPAEARQRLLTALGIYARLDGRLGRAHCLVELGDLEVLEGNIGGAQQALKTSSDLFDEVGSRSGKARCLFGLGELSLACNDLAQASTQLSDAAAVFQDRGDLQGAANCHVVLGKVAMARREPVDAAVELALAEGLYRDTEDRQGEANCRLDRAGLVAMTLGVAEAEPFLAEAMSFYEEVADWVGQANCHLVLGIALLRERRDLDRARAETERAREIFDRLDVTSGRASCLVLIGIIDARAGNHDAAEVRLAEAISLLAALGDHRRTAVAAMLSGEARLASGDHRGAIDRVLHAVTEVESLRGAQSTRAEALWWLGELSEVYTRALYVAVEVGDAIAGLQVIEAARAEILAGLLRAGDPEDIDPEVAAVIQTILVLQAELSPLGGLEGGVGLVRHGPLAPVTSGADVIARRVDRDRRLELAVGDLERLVGDFAHQYVPAPLAPGEAERLIPQGAWLLEYHLEPGGQLTRVWATPTGDLGIDRVTLPDGMRTQLFPALMNLGSKRASDLVELPIELPAVDAFWIRALGHLGALLLPPVVLRGLGMQRSDAPARVLIIPSGPLWAVPWAALPVGGRRLCHVASVALAPSLRSIPAQGGAPGEGMVALVDPGLEYGQEELSFLKELYALALICGDPTAFKDALRSPPGAASRYQTGHVTCHGDSKPGLAHSLTMESGEVVLSAAEMLALRLPAHLHMGTCSSGHVQDGREPIGLATVALSRGVQHVTAACWPIPKIGAPGMSRIYHQHVTGGLAPPEALRRTQVEISGTDSDAPLWEWAPYVVFGRP